MTAYRSYFLDLKDKIQGFTEFDAASDDDALAHVEAIKDEHFAVEVWEGSRLVGRVGGELDLTTAARGEQRSARG